MENFFGAWEEPLPSLTKFLWGSLLSVQEAPLLPPSPLPPPLPRSCSTDLDFWIPKAEGKYILQVTSLSCFPLFLRPPPRQEGPEHSSPMCLAEERKFNISKNCLVHFFTLITKEIPRVLGALCQKQAKTRYIFDHNITSIIVSMGKRERVKQRCQASQIMGAGLKSRAGAGKKQQLSCHSLSCY